MCEIDCVNPALDPSSQAKHIGIASRTEFIFFTLVLGGKKTNREIAIHQWCKYERWQHLRWDE